MQALIDAGWSAWDETVNVAHVGEFPATGATDVEPVDASNVAVSSTTRGSPAHGRS